MENQEIWKDVIDHQGFYQVSNLGRVKSLDREFTRKCGKKQKIKGQFIKPSKNQDGYSCFILQKVGKKISAKVHIEVCKSFLGYIPDLINSVVNHKDLDKSNNSLSNLEIVNSSQNRRHSIDKTKTSSKYFCVSLRKDTHKWQVKKQIKDKQITLGCYDSEYDAHLAYESYIKSKNTVL